MKIEVNILEQIHQKVESLFGSKRESEYFCLVLDGPAIQENSSPCNDEKKSMRLVMEEDRLTNCLCTPYQIVQDVQPFTLASRYSFVLSMWTIQRHLFYEQDQIWQYKSEDEYLSDLQRSLNKSDELLQIVDKKKAAEIDWKQVAEQLRITSFNLLRHYKNQQKAEEGIGEIELLEAKECLRKSRMITLEHQAFYPVICKPDNWNKTLKSSFSEMDLLPSLHACMQSLIKMSLLIEDQLKKLMLYQEDETLLIQDFQRIRQNVITSLIEIIPSTCDAHDQSLLFHFSLAITKPNRMCRSFYQALNSQLHQTLSVQQLHTMFTDCQNLVKEYWHAYEKVQVHTYQNSLFQSIVNDLKQYYQKWTDLQRQMYLANRKTLTKQSETQTLLPQNIPKGYDKVVCNSNFAAFYQNQLHCEQSSGINLQAFFGASIPYDINEEKMKAVKISVGCIVTKIQIQRPWMDEGIFSLSYAYSRFNKQRASLGIHNLKKVSKKSLLPSYPIQMVVAKDVTIRLDFTDAGNAMMKLVKAKAINGNGFLCFRDENSTFIPVINRDEHILTLRYPKAFLLGYFMRYTPKDKSHKLGGTVYGKNK